MVKRPRNKKLDDYFGEILHNTKIGIPEEIVILFIKEEMEVEINMLYSFITDDNPDDQYYRKHILGAFLLASSVEHGEIKDLLKSLEKKYGIFFFPFSEGIIIRDLSKHVRILDISQGALCVPLIKQLLKDPASENFINAA